MIIYDNGMFLYYLILEKSVLYNLSHIKESVDDKR